MKEQVFMEPDTCRRVIDDYRNVDIEALDLRENVEYLAEVLLQKMKSVVSFKKEEKKPTSLEGALHVLDLFKDWVENNRGWEDIHNAPSKRKEKAVQRLIYLAGKDYMSKNDFDPSPETDSGRGPVDIKISRGLDKTVVEVKLSSNGQYLHGYQKQLQEYGKAEQTDKQIYVFVNVGNPRRLKTIKEVHHKNVSSGKICPELIIVDARPKEAASKYSGESEEDGQIDFDFGEMPSFDLSEMPEFDFPEWDIGSSDGYEASE
ncbi:MAG: hypothetical protein IKG87_16140 [Clostridia bacterium]|nr:hypothetical protein [Clostridia bacterium]